MAKNRSLKKKRTPHAIAAAPPQRWWTNLQISERQADRIAGTALRHNLTPPQFIIHACAVYASGAGVPSARDPNEDLGPPDQPQDYDTTDSEDPPN